MAQLGHLIFVEGNFVETSDGPRRLTEESTTTIESSVYFPAQDEFTNTSTNSSNGCASSSDPAPSSSENFSTRIQSMMETRSKFGTNVETQFEASKDHWSELQAENGEEGSLDEEGSSETNLEVFQSLQKQWPNGFFRDWNDEAFGVGEKVAEGAQGEIFKLRFLKPEHAHFNEVFVLKVFRPGFSLHGLQQQWPKTMLQMANTSKKPYYMNEGSSLTGGMLLKDGRFAFYMARCWGDLQKIIELRMKHNHNRAPPFIDDTTLVIMFHIARGMRALHRDNILHRDLKASNVLISPACDGPLESFNPISDNNFASLLADYECSVGVVGTRFWRAPEILLGVKKRDVNRSLFTKKSDVYSYAMTCYEILTGMIPLKEVPASDYDPILQGKRPLLPSGTKPWIQALLSRCWQHDPSQRPSFDEIMEGFEKGVFWGFLIS